MGVLTPQFGSIVPSQTQQVLNTNYLVFDGAAGGNFAQQYLPEVYEAEVERYGNRTLGGFLRMVGAELPMTSDQVIWSEQNRLHISYDSCTLTGVNTVDINLPVVAGVNNVITPNMTVVIMDPLNPAATVKAFVSGVLGTVLTAYPYQQASLQAAFGAGAAGLKTYVYGSEFGKASGLSPAGVDGTGLVTENIDPAFTQFSNKPIIIRDRYAISGSDTAQIGWVEVSAEDGVGGFLWYLKAEGETRLRFEDYLEMVVIEGQISDATSGPAGAPGGFYAAAIGGAIPAANNTGFSAFAAGNQLGTQGMFDAIQARGNVMTGFAGGMADFDAILQNLDSQGAIEENMLFLDRATELNFDNMLAVQNSYGAGGTSYGVFENSEEMALNLGFSGFRRGSYDFYKTSWKYLNDASTRGGSTNFNGASNVEGVLVPAGTSTVYDQVLGTNIRRPFLHVRYRASQADDRRMKSWLTGSVGGAYTSDVDVMQVNFLSERCLCVQAANNFVLFSA